MQSSRGRHALDFYVRMCEADFARLPMRHRETELDFRGAACAFAAGDAASLASLGGCSEWICPGDPAISVGWDWLLMPGGEVVLNPHSIRTNLELEDPEGRPLGFVKTMAAIVRRVHSLHWRNEVLALIGLNHGGGAAGRT